MQKIFLIGYMGCGKTSTGNRIAERLGLQFFDIDCFIENRHRKTIAEIFAEKGENGFREMRKKVLQEVVQFEDIVVSTGGGVPCFFDHMANETGTTVYLKVGVDELTRRMSNSSKDKRPIVKDKSKSELKTFIADNLAKREPFYNQEKYVYEVEQAACKKDINTLVTHLIACLSEEKIMTIMQKEDKLSLCIENKEQPINSIPHELLKELNNARHPLSVGVPKENLKTEKRLAFTPEAGHIIGAGVAGMTADRVALALGATVKIFDSDYANCKTTWEIRSLPLFFR